jgi:hypothetical protein
MVFHVQLLWRSWLQEQKASHTFVTLSYVCVGIWFLEQQNNLSWVPWVSHVQALQSLMHVAHPSPSTSGNAGTRSPVAPSMAAATVTGSAATTYAPARCEPRSQARNPAWQREFTGAGPLATMVRTRHVSEAIDLAGSDPPRVMQNGTAKKVCISWYARGTCFDNCDRDHTIMSADEGRGFIEWCQVGYAWRAGRRHNIK